MIFFDIDTQHDFMDPDGALYVRGAETINANLERLLRAAARAGITTVSSADAHRQDDPEFADFPPHCVAGTYGAERIFPDLPNLRRREIPVGAAPEPEAKIEPATHYLVKKQTFDVFSNPWLEALRQGGAFNGEQCVVFGVAADYCVRAAALSLAAANARVLVVEDAVRGVAPDSTARTMEELQAAGIELTTTDKVLQSLAQADEVHRAAES
jgi:nicotinamidase/pyrazinamidase